MYTMCILESITILKDKLHLVENSRYHLNIVTAEMLPSLSRALSEITTLQRQAPMEEQFWNHVFFYFFMGSMTMLEH